MRCVIPLVSALLVVAPAAQAVVGVSADRLVEVAVLSEDLSESLASSSFGLFDEALWAEQVAPGTPVPFYDYRASASQTSTIDANGVTAVGQSHIDGLVYLALCGDPQCTPAAARSTLEWTFDVTSPNHFALSGTLATEVTDPVGGTPFAGEVTARVRLEDVSGGGATVAEFASVPTSATPCCETVDVAADGALPPGSYRLVVESWATYPFYHPLPYGSGDASFDVTLAFAPPGVPVPEVAPLLLAAGLLLVGATARGRLAARSRRGAAH